MPAEPRSTKSIELRILLTLGILLIVLALAAALYCLYQHEAGRRELARVQREFSTDGTLRPISEIAPQPSEALLQNNRDFIAATADLATLNKSDLSIYAGPVVMRFSAPGLATSGAAEPVPVFDYKPDTDAPKSWDAFRQRLAPGSEIMCNAKAILQKPLGFPHKYATQGSLDPVAPAQKLTAWLRADATLRLHEGDLAGAIDDLEAIARLASYVGGPRTLICDVLQMGIWTFGLRSLIWEALQSPSVTEPDLARLAQIASSQDFLADALPAMQVEAALQPIFYQQIEETPADRFEVKLFSGPDWLWQNKVGISFQKALWQTVWADADQAQAISLWAKSIREMRLLLIDKNWPRAKAALAAFSLPADHGFPVARSFWGDDTIGSFVGSSVRAETLRQLIVGAIALERYRLKNSAYPASLDQLIPAYLPVLPADYFDGRALKYKLLPSGQYLLYSVGKDGIDDGGDASPKDKSASPSLDNGRDFVWPRLAK